MSKSAIYTAMITPTAVAIGGLIPLGTTIRRFGQNIVQDGNTITVTGAGYYKVSVSITVAPTAVGSVGATLLKDGVSVSGALSSSSVSTANNPTTLGIEAIVRNTCDCDSSILSLMLTTTGSNVLNTAVTVEKI